MNMLAHDSLCVQFAFLRRPTRRSYVRKSHRRCLGFFLHVNFRDPICYLYAKLKHTLRLAAVLLSVPRCPLHKKSCLFHSSEIVKIKVVNTVTYQNQLQPADIGLPTGNGEKSSCSQAQLGQATGLALA